MTETTGSEDPGTAPARPSAMMPSPTSNIRTVDVKWEGEMRFRGGSEGGPTVLIDAGAVEAPGPMLTLLVAVAACGGADIVSILEKMQVRLERLETRVEGVRAPDHPRRYIKLHLVYRLGGAGLDENKARRAIDLSISKYCSVLHSLNPDIPVSYDLVLA